MSTNFGSRIVGQEAHDKAVREQKAGADVYGVRVRGAITGSGPTAEAKKQSEFGVRTLEDATFQDKRGEIVDGISIDDLRNALAENPTFFDSLYEAELGRSEGPRVDALSIFAEVERGIKGAGRREILDEINALLGKSSDLAAADANANLARREVLQAQQQRTEENVKLRDAARIKSLKEREENLKIVEEGSDGGKGQLIASTTEGQVAQIAKDKGLDITGGSQQSREQGSVGAKPAGDIKPETSSPRGDSIRSTSTDGKGATNAENVSGESSKTASDEEGEESSSESESKDYESMQKAELEELFTEEEFAKIRGTGADGAVLKADLVRTAKRLKK